MDKFETKIQLYIESLLPKQLGENKNLKVRSISGLGQGTGNLNYLVKANGKKFVFRMNMNPKNRKKSRREFDALRIIEPYDIGPKAIFIDESRKSFDSDLLILEYLEGKTLNKSGDYLKPIMYRKIGELCANMHSIKIKGNLRRLGYNSLHRGYSDHMRFVKKEFIDYLNSKINDKELLKIIKEVYSNQSKNLPREKYEFEDVLSQGDFCEQNVIVHKKEYKLIDFEDMGLADRANQISHIFADFGRPFNKEQQRLFFKTYLKKIKLDKKALNKKIERWIPLKLFEIFLWSLKHVLIVKEGKMHPQFYENEDMNKNISYAKTMLKRCIRFGVIDKKYKGLDIENSLLV